MSQLNFVTESKSFSTPQKLLVDNQQYEVQWHADLKFVDQNTWGSIAQNNPFLSYHFLDAFVNGHPESTFHFAIVYKNTKPVLVAVFQNVLVNGDTLANMVYDLNNNSCTISYKRGFASFIRKTADTIKWRLLIVGNSMISGEHGFAFKGIEGVVAVKVVNGLIEHMLKHEKEFDRASIVLIKDFEMPSIIAANHFTSRGFYSFNVEPNMVLNLNPNWVTFQDYVMAMNKKYRNRTKNIRLKGAALIKQDMSATDLKQHAERLYELYLNVIQKAGFSLLNVDQHYLLTLKAALNESFKVYGYWLDGTLVGFRSTFVYDGILEAHLIGLDYPANNSHQVYLNMLYDYIEEGINEHKRQINFGRTAAEIKSTVGAVPVALTCYIRHRNAFSNRLVRPFFQQLKPSVWVPRHPFKNE